MNSHHRTIRALITSMSPKRAKSFIEKFDLREDEESVLIQADVRGLSQIQVADELHMTPETVKRRRRAAYSKIADAIKYDEGRG